MFGDDPDPTVTIVRIGSGTAFGRAREEVRCTVQRGVGMGLGGLWRAGWAEMRGEECSPATVSGDRKRPTLDRLYCRYSLTVGLSNELRMR